MVSAISGTSPSAEAYTLTSPSPPTAAADAAQYTTNRLTDDDTVTISAQAQQAAQNSPYNEQENGNQ